jgi:hypothetical protein
VSQRTKKRDTAGAKAAISVARWIEPWGEARFPVDVDLLAKGCHTMYGRDDPITQVHGASWKGIDGFLQRNPDNAKEWWITYSTNVGAERQRFTKAHELGHYILHSQKKAEFRCGPDVIIEKDTGEPNIEAQANQFASYLLMPANHVRPSIEKSPITLDLISDLAKFYGVSFEAMCIRFVEITGERAVLVYWDNGMMKRWSRSEPCEAPAALDRQSERLSTGTDSRHRGCRPVGAPVPGGATRAGESVVQECAGRRDAAGNEAYLGHLRARAVAARSFPSSIRAGRAMEKRVRRTPTTGSSGVAGRCWGRAAGDPSAQPDNRSYSN